MTPASLWLFKSKATKRQGTMTSQSSSPEPFSNDSAVESANSQISGRGAYNLVSDTVAGVNVRKSDNLFQLKAIFVCLMIGGSFGAIGGGLYSDPGRRLVGAVVAGIVLSFAGVVIGLFGSGIFLMIYRAVCHLKGKHD